MRTTATRRDPATTAMDAISNDQIDSAPLARATVLSVDGGRVACRHEVALERGGGESVCDVLHTSAQPVRLSVGDTVLVWHGAGAPIVLGRIGPSYAPAPDAPDAPAVSAVSDSPDLPDVPDELLLEARQSLTLRVGDGSITIRADGRILIKGRDLVSHAQRTNRIRGGSVAIN